MSIKDKLLKNSKSKFTSTLNDSKIFGKSDMIQTSVPVLNLAFSGEFDGGFIPGFTMIAGPSKHFKTGFSLVMAKAYLDKYDDAVILFYDTEFGSPEEYFETFDIDFDRVIHTPITNIEELKFDIMSQLEQIDRSDHVFILIDSIGNIASKKEVEDAMNEKSVADMSRAKQLKSLFRMVTPHLKLKDIPLVAINHTYKEQSLFPKDIVSGGTGAYYSADTIWIIGRQQEKDSKGISGYNFVINVEKSRFVREKSKIPVSIRWEDGIQKWSGLLDLALETGFIRKVKPGKYAACDSDIEYAEKKLLKTDPIWEGLLMNTEFTSACSQKYKVGYGKMFNENRSLQDSGETTGIDSSVETTGVDG